MKRFCLLCATCLGLSLQALALSKGMTIAAVEAEQGKPISEMKIGDRTILIYADQQRLEFKDGKLISGNGVKQLPDTATKPIVSKSPALEVELPVSRPDQTITESSQSGFTEIENIGQNYDFGTISDDVSEAIQHYDKQSRAAPQSLAREHLRDVLIGFILEAVLTLIVLQVAFSISGFPALFRQLALLSLVVALAGGSLQYMLFIGLFNPIRIGVSFILLLALIRQMTDVRDWATAIRISLMARLISLGLMWLAFAGVMVLFGL